MKDRIIGPFFFCEPTVTGPVYLDILEQFMYPQVAAFQSSIIYQQYGAPPRWSIDVRGSLNATFPNRWIGGDIDMLATTFTGSKPLHFFFWHYVKDRVFATLANDIEEL